MPRFLQLTVLRHTGGHPCSLIHRVKRIDPHCLCSDVEFACYSNLAQCPCIAVLLLVTAFSV